MGVDDSDCLKKGVKDGGAHKAHTPLSKIGRKLVGKGRAGAAAVVNDFPVPELEKVLTEAAKLFLNLQKHLSVLDRSQNFPAVSDDSAVLEQGINLVRSVVCNDLGVKAVKGLPEVFLFIQDTFPG